MPQFNANLLPDVTGRDLGSPSQRWDVYAQTLSMTSFSGVRYADQYSGADAGAQIAAAIADLPSTGGVVDARGFDATSQTISSTITVGSSTKPVKLIFNPATVFHASADNVNLFNLGSNSEISDLYVYLSDRLSYTGNVISLVDLYTDGERATLRNVRIMASGVVGGKGIYITGTNTTTQRVAFVTLDGIRIFGLSRGIHIKTSGSGWVNGNHFSNIEITDSVIPLEMESTSATAGSVIEGNLFSNFSIEGGSHTTAGIKLNTTAGQVRYNQFLGMDIWDTTSVPPIQVVGAASVNNLFVGRWDGTYSDASRQNNYISLLGGIYDTANLSPWFNNSAHVNGNLLVGGTSPTITANGTTGDIAASTFSGAHNGSVGATTPSTGVFTAVNGPIGTVTPAAGTFTTAAASTSLTLGGGTAITKMVVYTPTLTPASVNAVTVAEQTFTVTGLTTADKVIVNPPAIANSTGICGVRVSAADTLAIRFNNPTAGPLTPTSGTYTVIAVRS